MADAFRVVILAQGIFLVGFSLAVMTEAKKFRAPPRHVVAIATSYIVLVVGYMAELTTRIGEDFNWRSGVAFGAFALGIYSMRLMWTAYQYASRMKRHERQTITAANRLMGQAFGNDEEEEPK